MTQHGFREIAKHARNHAPWLKEASFQCEVTKSPSSRNPSTFQSRLGFRVSVSGLRVWILGFAGFKGDLGFSVPSHKPPKPKAFIPLTPHLKVPLNGFRGLGVQGLGWNCRPHLQTR